MNNPRMQVDQDQPVALFLFCPPVELGDCRCGNGWCEQHGSYHYTDSTELFEEELRAIRRPSRGRRVARKQVGGDNY